MATASVNKPTDSKQKEIDINTKLQLYGIYSAFSNGKVPSNKQIDVALNTALESKAFRSPSGQLSDDGKTLVADLRDVIEKAKVLLLTKNEGNLLQDFIWQTQQLGVGNVQKPGAPIDKDTAKQHGQEALEGLRTLGTLLISNGQFRKLLSDASVLARSMVTDAATKTADKVGPSQEQLDSLDDAAPDDTWHDVPDLSKGTLKQQLKDKNPIKRKQAEKALGDATESAHPGGSRDPAEAADLAARDQEQGTDSGVDAVGGAKAGAETLKQTASENVPDEQKEKARKLREKTGNYFKEKMPKERREQTIWRLKKMIVEVQGHSDYQQAIETLLRLAEEYTGHAKNAVEADLKTLLERFANNSSTDDMFDAINQIYRDADNDKELKNWFKSMDSFVRKCLQRQGFILEDKSNEEWNELYDHGRYLLREKYRDHTDHVLDEVKHWGNQFDADPQNKAFGDAVQKLFLDLGNDENGQPTFKPHLLKDLTEVIVPAIFENVRYIPIPRIEYSDKMMDAVVENLVIEGDNLAPNIMEFSTDNYWRWGRKKIANKNKNKIMLSVSGIQADLRDVAYYVKKKEGFPGVTDQGIMDVILGGSGFSFKIAMETPDDKDRQHFFKVNTVTVDVKNLSLKMKKSNHKLLFNIAKPLLLKVMKPVIQKVLEKQLKDTATELDSKLWAVHQEAKKAEAEAKANPDPENIQNIYQRYATAAQKQFMKGQKKAEETSADKKVNMAVTQQDSILKNIKLPGGISSKATDYKELAAKGEKWESPVFSIGSAKESSGLPTGNQINRRQDGATTGAGAAAAGAGAGRGATSGTTGSGLTNGATGLSNQMKQAFDGSNDLSLGKTGGMNGSTPGMNGTARISEHTTLGSSNPVLTGSA